MKKVLFLIGVIIYLPAVLDTNIIDMGEFFWKYIFVSSYLLIALSITCELVEDNRIRKYFIALLGFLYLGSVTCKNLSLYKVEATMIILFVIYLIIVTIILFYKDINKLMLFTIPILVWDITFYYNTFLVDSENFSYLTYTKFKTFFLVALLVIGVVNLVTLFIAKENKVKTKNSISYTFLGFFLPLIGIILYAVQKRKKPLIAISAGKGALISMMLYVPFIHIFYRITYGLY